MTPTSPPSQPDWAQDAEGRVLDEAVRLAADHPWTAALTARAAKAAGLTSPDAELLLPGGARDLAALLWRRHDGAALVRLEPIDPTSLKVRERIRLGVQTRVEAAMVDEAAVKRAALVLARPDLARLDGAGLAPRLAWASADQLWRWAGDTATDENHYTKRAIVAAVLTSTLAVRLSLGRDRASAYLGARIDNVMAFEKWKAALPRPLDAMADVAGVLGRLRYGRDSGVGRDRRG